MKNYKARKTDDLNKLAKIILDLDINVILLKGDLGAGKTTLTQKIGQTLGINTRINSPTFTILKQHKITEGKYNKLLHYDLYRLTKEEEVKELGIYEEAENKKNLVVIEWPELVIDRFKKYILLEFEIKKIGRNITISVLEDSHKYDYPFLNYQKALLKNLTNFS